MRPLAAAVSAAVTSLVVTMLLTGEAESSAPPGGVGSDRLEVYLVEVGPSDVELLAAAGVDTTHLPDLTEGGRVEIVATSRQARALRHEGLSVQVKRIHGVKASTVAAQRLAAGQAVFRTYGGPGGIAEELREVAAQHKGMTKLVTIGTSRQGQPILALKVSNNARSANDGKRPAVLYLGAQHAREWITPEMVRRLMHHVIDSYGADPAITSLLKSTELWFVPVANPDGYDYTFSTERFWRKNLRDNNGDGQITVGDGVDPNRNYPTKWGWDNEGSSPDPADETYRGPSPASEPETQAVTGLLDRVGFEYLINYHSAAELLLYGVGWQVSTPSPDDLIYEAMAGDDADPAVPGYDPDISAELYTVNGETLMQAAVHNGTLGFTPEMSTCQTASDANPDDEWLAEDCLMVFDFPDDEALIQAEYAKNVPFALAVARSAADPDDPVSVVGRTVPDLVPDAFSDSYGTTQPVAVLAKRALGDKRLRYSVNGGPTRTAGVSEWNGGERYGDGYDRYIAEYRGTVTGTSAGDSVRVWFTAKRGKTTVTSPDFTYQVATDIGGDVLVLAAEDVTGASPAQAAASAEVRRVVRRRPRGRRLHLGRLRRRHPWSSGSAPPRGAVALRRGGLGDRRRHHSASDRTTGGHGRPAGAGPRAHRARLPQRGRQGPRHGQVQPVRPGGGRRLLVQPVRASAVHDAERVPVPAAAQRLPAVLAGGLRLPRRHGRGRERRARAPAG